MTKTQYADAIAALGLNQTTAANFLQIGDRTSRRWVAGTTAVPHAVKLLLNLMVARKIKPEDLQTL